MRLYQIYFRNAGRDWSTWMAPFMREATAEAIVAEKRLTDSMLEWAVALVELPDAAEQRAAQSAAVGAHR